MMVVNPAGPLVAGVANHPLLFNVERVLDGLELRLRITPERPAEDSYTVPARQLAPGSTFVVHSTLAHTFPVSRWYTVRIEAFTENSVTDLGEVEVFAQPAE